jgi:hypothetical protein
MWRNELIWGLELGMLMKGERFATQKDLFGQAITLFRWRRRRPISFSGELELWQCSYEGDKCSSLHQGEVILVGGKCVIHIGLVCVISWRKQSLMVEKHAWSEVTHQEIHWLSLILLIPSLPSEKHTVWDSKGGSQEVHTALRLPGFEKLVTQLSVVSSLLTGSGMTINPQATFLLQSNSLRRMEDVRKLGQNIRQGIDCLST